MFRTSLIAAAIGLAGASSASAEVLIDQDFEAAAVTLNANLNYVAVPGGVPVDSATNLARYGNNGGNHTVVKSNTGSPPLKNYGNASKVLRVGTNNASGGMFIGDPVSEATTITTTSFSVLAGYDYQDLNFYNASYDENKQGTGGCLTFGWTAISASTDFFSPAQPTFMAGVRHLRNGTSPDYAPSTYTLALGTGTGGGLSTTLTGAPAAGVLLTQGHWYLLHGTVDFNSTTKQFTVDVHLDDYGIDGQTLVLADVLAGTGTSAVTTFGTTGQAAFHADGARGFGVVDDLYAQTVPEPASLVLLALGGLVMCSRRRSVRERVM
jgi:hypothetical protein